MRFVFVIAAGTCLLLVFGTLDIVYIATRSIE